MISAPAIKKLDQGIVSRIAAGEVIQRPSNALKELLENSLDAQATKIKIVVKNGGLKTIYIVDNGTGIRKEDLAIVCERFTTSKLSKFEDLKKISTYGFRGEALASISHVAYLTITTKVEGSPVGFRAEYKDGKLKGPPKPIAAERGTQITVEELFYNVASRRNSLKNPTEEYKKIMDIVKKYAVHNSNVAFSLSRQNELRPELFTPPNSNVVHNIGVAFGDPIAQELIEIKNSDDILKFELYGQITNANYSHKKLIFLLFINHRLVVCNSLKVMIEQVYDMYLPKNGNPFVYLSIIIDPLCVDVNVHPTKHEVHLMYEDKIVNKVRSVLENALLGCNMSRVFHMTAKPPVTITSELPAQQGEEKILDVPPTQYAQNTIRVDSEEQKIEKFLKSSLGEGTENLELSSQDHFKSSERRDITLGSITQLKDVVQNSVNLELQNIIRNFVFVGILGRKHCVAQYETKVYMCNTDNLTREMMYQILLNDFGNFGVIRLSNPLPIKELVLAYFEGNPSSLNEADGSKEDVAKSMTRILVENSQMLDDYFSIEIDDDGNICTLPWVLEKFVPDVQKLPLFIVKVCSEVDWTEEKPCLEGICREISKFYSKIPEGVEDADKTGTLPAHWKWVTEHVLFPTIKNSLLPPANFAQDGTVTEVANLSDMYKLFERC